MPPAMYILYIQVAFMYITYILPTFSFVFQKFICRFAKLIYEKHKIHE